MSEPEPERAGAPTERALRQRRRTEAALVLPFIGVIALASPVVTAVTGDLGLGGLARAVVFIFAVWAILIVVTYLLARHLADDMPDT